jgi:hypothetical protein
VFYFALFFGLTLIDAKYVRWLSTAVQLFVGSFLVLRFAPMMTATQTVGRFDKHVIFAAAIFMLINTLTTEIFQAFRVPFLL